MVDKVGKNSNYLSKNYGPGFVAVSEKTGRVLAHGSDIKKMFEDG